MSGSDDMWSHMDRFISIWNILMFLSGFGLAGGTMTYLNNLPPYLLVGFFTIAFILIVASIWRSYLAYSRWKLIHNQKYPQATDIAKALWNMHVTLGELIAPANSKYIKTKEIKNVSYKIGELLGIGRKKHEKLKPNKITFLKLLWRLSVVYRIKPKEILSLVSVSNDLGHLMDKGGWGLSNYLSDKKYFKMLKQFNVKKLELDISPETSVLIDNVNLFSYGLYSLSVAGKAMVNNPKFKKWLGTRGINSMENTINSVDILYQAALLEVKSVIIHDLSDA